MEKKHCSVVLLLNGGLNLIKQILIIHQMQRTFLISKHIKQDRLYLHEWQSKIRMFKCYSSYLVGNNDLKLNINPETFQSKM